MPFYQVLIPAGALTPQAKQEMVGAITRIHCDSTGAPGIFVHIQFDEVAPGNAFQDGKPSRALRLYGRIRAGRSPEVKLRMLSSFTEMLTRIGRVPVQQVMVTLIENSHENAMEAGIRLPAVGGEAAWLEQNRKHFGLAD